MTMTKSNQQNRQSYVRNSNPTFKSFGQTYKLLSSTYIGPLPTFLYHHNILQRSHKAFLSSLPTKSLKKLKITTYSNRLENQKPCFLLQKLRNSLTQLSSVYALSSYGNFKLFLGFQIFLCLLTHFLSFFFSLLFMEVASFNYQLYH